MKLFHSLSLALVSTLKLYDFLSFPEALSLFGKYSSAKAPILSYYFILLYFPHPQPVKALELYHKQLAIWHNKQKSSNHI